MSRCRSQLPLFPDRDSTLRPNAEPRDTRPVRPLEIKRHEWSKISPCGPQADDDDGLSLVVEDSQKRWMSAITSWCVKSCPRNASGKRILHFSNRFGSASEQVEVDLAFQLSRSLTE